MEPLPRSRKLSINQSTESIERDEQLLIKSFTQSFEKVMKWFEKNDNQKYGSIDYFDLISERSKEESVIESVASIETPSILSAKKSLESTESSHHEDNRKTYKPPVKPIKLDYCKTYEVQLLNFECIDSFFVVLKRDSERKWNRLMRRLNNIKDRLEPLPKISRASLCLIMSENELHRAIIQNNNTKYAICLGIDNGKTYILDTATDPLYKMTPKIRNTIEFQAVHCKLSDIGLPHNPEITKFVYDLIISKVQNPQIKLVKSKYSRYVDDRCMRMNKYEIMLYEGENEESINQKIAQTIQGRDDYNLDCF